MSLGRERSGRAADVTLLIQGPLNPSSLSRVANQLERVEHVIVSFWQAENNVDRLRPFLRAPGSPPSGGRGGLLKTAVRDPAGAARMRLDVRPHDRFESAEPRLLLVEIAGERDVTDVIAELAPPMPPPGEATSSDVEIEAIYRQCMSTLAGLDEVETRYVIKVRSDEFYELDAVIRRIHAQPTKMITNNIFVDGIRHFKLSDHLIAGATEDLRATFRIAKERAEAGDIYMEGINPRGQADHYQRRGGMNPNQLLCTSFLRVRGIETTVREAADLIERHFDIVPLPLLRPYQWAVSSKRAAPQFIERVSADPAFGRAIGVSLSPTHVLVSSETSPDSALETPSLAAGLFGVRPDGRPGNDVGFHSIEELAAAFREPPGEALHLGVLRSERDAAMTYAALRTRAVASWPRTALIGDRGEISYEQLWQSADRCAAGMVARGVRRGDVVAVITDRSPELISLVLACWRIGAVFMPIDAAYPEQRQRLMLGLAEPAMVISASEPRAIVDAVPHADLVSTPGGDDPSADVDAEDAAYLLYTSGTSGQPKGVLIPHRGIMNLAAVQSEWFRIGPDSTVLQFASPCFDAFISELVTVLSTGARLAIPRSDQLSSIRSLCDFIAANRVTVATLPPSLLALLSPEEMPSLVTVVAAGESCPSAVARTWGGSVHFINAYGPTECTVCATMGRWQPGDPLPPSIGRVIPGVEAFVVDDNLEPVADGTDGELLLSGIGLGLGYLRRPSETAAAFIGFERAANGRAYRTGDRVRRLADGTVEFRGRRDDQVKIAGYRIELAEIRSTIEEMPGVRRCELLVRGAGAASQLYGFVLLAGATIPDILAQCRSKLPAYMVPRHIVEVAALPLSANGKVDRSALLAMIDRPIDAPATAPDRLAAAWRDALELGGDVDEDAEFWSLGGTSLRFLALVERIESELDVELSPRALLARPVTLRWLRTLAVSGAQVDPSDAGFWLGEQRELPIAFLFPPITGDPYGLLEVGRRLAATRRTLCFAASGFFAGGAISIVEGLAEYYVAEIVRAVPHPGPVLLAAYSFGAIHAFEVARILRPRGWAPRLVLIDGAAPPPRGPAPPPPVIGFVMCRMLAATLGTTPFVTIESLTGMTEPQRIAAIRDQLTALGIATAMTSDAAIQRRLNVFSAAVHSLSSYDCAPQEIDVVQLLSQDGHPFPANPTPFAWRPFVRGHYEERTVPGAHFTVLAAMHAEQVARAILDAERGQ